MNEKITQIGNVRILKRPCSKCNRMFETLESVGNAMCFDCRGFGQFYKSKPDKENYGRKDPRPTNPITDVIDRIKKRMRNQRRKK